MRGPTAPAVSVPAAAGSDPVWVPVVCDLDDPERWLDVWPEGDERAGAVPGCFPSVALVAQAAAGALGLEDQLAVLAPLGRDELALLDPGARVDAVQGWERLAGMVAARQQDAIAAVADATEDLGLDPGLARHEIGAALRLSPLTADQRIRVALAVRDRLPRTRDLLRAGAISWRRASTLVDVVEDLDPATVAAVETRLAARLPGMTAAETRRAARDALVQVAPQAATDKLTKGHAARRVERMDQADGTRSWWFPLTPDTEHDMWSALTRRARATKHALRTAGLPDPGLDALRVDTITDLVLGRSRTAPAPVAAATPTDRARHADPPDHTDRTDPADHANHTDHTDHTDPADHADHADPAEGTAMADGAAIDSDNPAAVAGLPPVTGMSSFAGVPRCSCGGAQVAAVVLDLPTAMGMADNPGRLAGYGAIPGPLARSLAKDRDWLRFVTDPVSGQLLDRGWRSYRPSDRLRAFIIARDQTCGFPGCHRPAEVCDCDHIVNHRTPDGRTVRVNLGPLCRQHHNAKTHGRWRVSYDPKTKVKTWISPLGRRYTKGTDPPLL